MNVTSRPRRSNHPILWTLAVVAVVAVVAFAVTAYMVFGPAATSFAGGNHVPLADYHEQDPTGVPVELKSATLIERGEYMTRAADCAACHTAKGGIPFAGGRAFKLPFGTMYSTNITPDFETGIGGYSDQNFLEAIHKGIGRGNVKLYPSMPYASYTLMSDADALAIKAYLFSLKPLHARTPPNSLVFPFNQRILMSVWSLMFNSDKRYEPHPDRSAEWNRGAYLTEAMGHCGECHTPRNLFFALNNREKYAGAVQSGWRAYNITADHGSGLGTWSDEQLANYLSVGHADGRGTASGPMGEAVEASLRHLSAGDISAMVAYLRTIPGVASGDLAEPKQTPTQAAQSMASTIDPNGKAVYEGACAGCHGWTGISPVLPLATLTGTRSVNDPTATNVAQVTIGGAQRRFPNDTTHMPAFGDSYSDAEIASVANYVTAQFGATGSDLTAARIAKLRAQD